MAMHGPPEAIIIEGLRGRGFGDSSMSTAARIQRFTAAEYLALERKAPQKSEYRRGYIVAMPGVSREHNLIAGNLHGIVWTQLQERPCEAYFADVRVRTGLEGLYTYPDVAVVCGEPLFEDDQLDTLLNPTLIAEVLSPSTEDYDRGEKFEDYKEIPTPREYLLIAQDRVFVERFVREGDDWGSASYESLDDTLPLDAIGCSVPVRQLYAKVKLPG